MTKSQAMFLAILILAPTSQAAADTLRGQVFDQTGAVITGASVTAEPKGMAPLHTVTGATGEFRFENLPGPALTIRVEREGFLPAEQTATGTGAPLRIVLAPAPVSQSVTVTESTGYRIPVATTATRTPTPLRDVPQSIQAVGRDLMEAQAALSMQDVLRNVSGVSLHLGEGRRDQVYIRGFDAMRDSYVDGVRDDATYYRDLSNVEQVEVIKGPASVLYGRGSSGGLINRVTKKPNPEVPLGEVGVVVGSYGTKRTTADLGFPVLGGKLAFRLNGAYEDSGSHRHYYALDRYTLSPSAVWNIGENTQLLGQFDHLNDDRVPDRGIPSIHGFPAPVGVGASYGYPQDDFINNQVTAQALTLDHRFTTAWNVRNVFRHSKYRTAYSNTFPSGIRMSGDDYLVTRGQYNSNGYQENYFNQTETVASFTWLGMRHTLLTGFEFGSQGSRTDRFTGSAGSVPLVNPLLTRPNYNPVLGRSNFFDGTVYGVYAQDQITLSRRWKALAGIRHDRYRQSLDDFLPAGNNLGRVDNNWSPRAGLVYQPNSWASLYASYSRSFQPSGEGLSLATNNTDLKPETTENYEIGSKNDLLGGRLSATVAAFQLSRSNIKTTDPIDPNRLVLVGKQRTAGVELSLAGTLARRWSVYGGYAWLSTRILRSNSVSSGVPLQGNRAGHIPLNSANLWSTYAFDNGFGIGGGFTYNADRFTSNDNLVVLPSYYRFDATVFYRRRHYDLALNLRNVFNTRYYETAHGNFMIYPGAPVNGLMTLRYRW